MNPRYFDTQLPNSFILTVLTLFSLLTAFEQCIYSNKVTIHKHYQSYKLVSYLFFAMSATYVLHLIVLISSMISFLNFLVGEEGEQFLLLEDSFAFAI